MNIHKTVLGMLPNITGQSKNTTTARLRVAFRANIDDLRESPALEIVKNLASKRLGKILEIEPNSDQLAQSLTDLSFELVSLAEASNQANTMVVLVDHKEHKKID